MNRVIVHPDYVDAPLGSDVALLRLERPVERCANVKPVKLSSLSEDVTPRGQCWVTGWGAISMSGTHRGCGGKGSCLGPGTYACSENCWRPGGAGCLGAASEGKEGEAGDAGHSHLSPPSQGSMGA